MPAEEPAEGLEFCRAAGKAILHQFIADTMKRDDRHLRAEVPRVCAGYRGKAAGNRLERPFEPNRHEVLRVLITARWIAVARSSYRTGCQVIIRSPIT